ncbi:MAG: hypothetical protein V4617_02725 [Gemmatimonadota bacterium]
MLAAQVRAQTQDRWAFGSGRAIAIIGRDYDSVLVEGQEFDITRRDSLLVIMVTVPPEPARRTVATTRIAVGSAPNLLPTQWSRGDTTFIVQPSYLTTVQRIRTYLDQSSAVAAFLR